MQLASFNKSFCFTNCEIGLIQRSTGAAFCRFCRIRSTCRIRSRGSCRILKLLFEQNLLFKQNILLKQKLLV